MECEINEDYSTRPHLFKCFKKVRPKYPSD